MSAVAESDAALRLIAFLLLVACQRFVELAVSARNGRRLLARGAREVPADGFPLLAAVHTLFPLALLVEVLALGATPGRAWPLWLTIWIGAQGLRWAAIRALGDRWHVRVLVLPGAPRVTAGPYRLLRHPNYLAVAIEFVAAPMLFGAWRTAVAVSLLNGVALARRIRVEETSLSGASSGAADPTTPA